MFPTKGIAAGKAGWGDWGAQKRGGGRRCVVFGPFAFMVLGLLCASVEFDGVDVDGGEIFVLSELSDLVAVGVDGAT